MSPRSAGKLHVGNLSYAYGVFAAEMVFEARNFFSREDEFKSAALAATRHFVTLLSRNGFLSNGVPDVATLPMGNTCVAFRIACKAKRARAASILVVPPEPKKDNGTGGDQVRN